MKPKPANSSPSQTTPTKAKPKPAPPPRTSEQKTEPSKDEPSKDELPKRKTNPDIDSLKIEGLKWDCADDWDIADGVVYYTNVNYGRSLYAIKTDNTCRRSLCEVRALDIFVVCGRVYFSNSNSNYSICSVKLDGTDFQVLNDEQPTRILKVEGGLLKCRNQKYVPGSETEEDTYFDLPIEAKAHPPELHPRCNA
jgi:hypothetical protein